MKKSLWLRAGLLFVMAMNAGAPAAQADRDIVYSARYYNRPGEKGTSKYHLYRINADGSGRKQLTRGSRDDQAPQWSPDRKKILFIRTDEKTSRDAISLVDAGGGAVKTVRTFASQALNYFRWSPKGDAIAVSCSVPMPGAKADAQVVIVIDLKGATKQRYDSRYYFAWSPNGEAILVGSDKSTLFEEKGWRIPWAKGFSTAMWLDNKTLIGIAARRDDVADYEKPWNNLLVTNTHAKERESKTVALKFWSESELDEARPYPSFFQRRPASTRTFSIAYDSSDSTIRPLYTFCLGDKESGQVKLLTQGQFLAWAADGQRFATAPGQQLADYGNPIDGRKRQVWVAPLQIGNGTSGKFKNIVSGLVHVVGADWRG